jgi:PP-loop superfamily ATP-utilizing enzyme
MCNREKIKMSKSNGRAVVLFSGGSDSMLTASIMAKDFSQIDLITFDRYGIFQVENSRKNVEILVDKFGSEKFTHHIINFNKVFKKISYQNYMKNIMQFGFMNLGTCGLCKLSMHVMTAAYCMQNNITDVADGANKGMEIFPAQMEAVIESIREMYREFGISYTNPVFEYAPPEDKNLVKDDRISTLFSSTQESKNNLGESTNTTGKKLFEEGLAPSSNVKGSDYDRKRQPRCFQFVLLSTYVNKWYLPKYSKDQYIKETEGFYSHKVKEATALLSEFKKGKYKDLFKVKEDYA